MNEDDLNLILTKHPITRDIFRGVFAANECPQIIPTNTLYIFNYSNRTEKGTHWVLLHINYKGVVTYVDPLGYPPLLHGLSEPLKNYKYIFYNKIPIQAPNTRSCGLFCCLFGIELCRGKSLYEIRNRFDFKDLLLNEKILQTRFLKEFQNLI